MKEILSPVEVAHEVEKTLKRLVRLKRKWHRLYNVEYQRARAPHVIERIEREMKATEKEMVELAERLVELGRKLKTVGERVEAMGRWTEYIFRYRGFAGVETFKPEEVMREFGIRTAGR